MNEVALSIAAATDVGKERTVNEDDYGYVHSHLGDILIVCDGMGGHAAGDVASRTAREALIREFITTNETNTRAVLYDAIHNAHLAVRAEAEKDVERSGMGTTCVVAVVQGNQVWIGNVGDSRAYIRRSSGALEQVSKDQTKGQELVDADLIQPEELQGHHLAGVLSQALGQKKELQPYIAETTLGIGEAILLCSDGVYDIPTQQELSEFLGLRNCYYAAANIVAYATEVDGKDNATVVIGRRMEQEGVNAPAPSMTTPVESASSSAWNWRNLLVSGVLGVLLGAGGAWATLSGPDDAKFVVEDVEVKKPKKGEKGREGEKRGGKEKSIRGKKDDSDVQKLRRKRDREAEERQNIERIKVDPSSKQEEEEKREQAEEEPNDSGGMFQKAPASRKPGKKNKLDKNKGKKKDKNKDKKKDKKKGKKKDKKKGEKGDSTSAPIVNDAPSLMADEADKKPEAPTSKQPKDTKKSTPTEDTKKEPDTEPNPAKKDESQEKQKE